MPTEDTLLWPFFADHHRAFAEQVQSFARARLQNLPHDDVDKACKTRVLMLVEAGILGAVVPREYGGLHPSLDARTICLAREILAFHDGLADFAFAMQGLGSGPITLFGSPDLKARYLPAVAQGKAIAAFALSEPEAGSDVAALAMTAKPDGSAHVRLNGTKTFISNGGIADFYVVFARSGEAPGAKGLSAFVVDADAPGLRVAERIEVIAPHPLATLAFDNVRVPVANRLGAPGEGFKVAMATLDIFRAERRRRGARLCPARAARIDRARDDAASVRRAARRPAADARRDRGERDRDRCRGVARLPRRLDEGSGRRARHPRSRDGENVRDRGGAARHRPRRAIVRRPRRHQGRQGRGALPRDPRACASTRARPKCRKS